MYICQIRRQAFYDLRAKGYSPIPIKRGLQRKPCIQGWPQFCERQATDQEIDYWSGAFNDCNIAVCGGYGGLMMVDIDDPAIVGDVGAILPTDTTGKHGSKGVTVFYRSSDTKSRVLKVNNKAAIEFLGAGRNSTVPPSIHDGTGKPYTWVSDLRPLSALPELPADAQRACYAVLVRRYGPDACSGDPDRATVEASAADQQVRPAGVADGRMRAWALKGLKLEAEKVANTGEGGRNRRLLDSVCALGKYVHHNVLSEEEVTERMVNACAENGFLYDLLRGGGMEPTLATIASGLRKSAGDSLPDIGQLTPEQAFGPPAGQTPPSSFPTSVSAIPAPDVFLDDGTIEDDGEELIQSLAPDGAGTVILLAGQSGVGKSFLAVALMAAIAAGLRDFMGLKNRNAGRPGFVVFVANEGEGTIRQRLQGFKLECGFPDRRLPFLIIKNPGPVTAQNGGRHILEIIRRFEAQLEMRCRLVCMDSLASSIDGEVDHNNSGEAAAVMQTMRQFSREAACPLLLIAHFGKHAESGIAGSHQWRAQADHAIYALGERDETTGTVRNRRLILGKSKISQEGPLFKFDLKPVALGINRYDEPKTTVIPVRVAGMITIDPDDAKGGKYNAAFDAAYDNAPENFGDHKGRTIKDVLEQFNILCSDEKVTARDRGWRRVMEKIKDGTSDRYIIEGNHVVRT